MNEKIMIFTEDDFRKALKKVIYYNLSPILEEALAKQEALPLKVIDNVIFCQRCERALATTVITDAFHLLKPQYCPYCGQKFELEKPKGEKSNEKYCQSRHQQKE